MKILIVIHQSLPRWLGGAEVYAHQLAQALNQRGHTVALFTREDGGNGLECTELDGVPVYRCHTPPMSDADKLRVAFGHQRVERAFDTVLDEFRPEGVNIHHLLGLSPQLFWSAARRGLPLILTLQDYWYVCANTKLLTNYNQTNCAGPRAWLNCAQCGAAKLGPAAQWIAPAFAPLFAARDLILRRLLHRADALIAPSHFLRETYVRLGAPPKRTHMIAGGIHLPPGAPTPLTEHGPLRVLFIGSLLPLKGAHTLVEAFNSLPPDAELTIAGDPQRDPVYAQHLRTLAHHPGVHWLGPVARGEVWQWFNWADVVAVPSLWYENAPLVMQEALAMRRPVIASRLGAMPEWVRDEVDGALFPAGNTSALSNLLLRLHHHRDVILRWHRQIGPVRTMADLAADVEAVYSEVIKLKAYDH